LVGPAIITEKYASGLNRLKEEYDKNPSGHELAMQHSDLVDEVVSSLLGRALDELGLKSETLAQDLAVVALGGYGRRELCPFSDIDLMVLHSIKDKSLLAAIAEKVFYPLWDLGLQVGHGMRTVKESLQMAAANFELQTSFLESRLITGSPRLVEKLQDSLTRQLRSRGGRRFLQNILAEGVSRHSIYGHTAYLLEPDLKEGEGGLRDIHAILWAAKGLLGLSSIKELIRSPYITSYDTEKLEAGLEFLLLVRNQLHYLSGRKNDRLFFEHQEVIAKALGFGAGNGISATEKFMRTFYTHASSIELISRGFWEQLKNDFLPDKRNKSSIMPKKASAGISLSGGKLSLVSASAVVEHPGAELKMFRRALEESIAIDYKKLDRIREGIKGSESPVKWTPEMRDDFFGIISYGEEALPVLEMMDHLGVISHYIPEWASVRCLPQYDSYHLFTVDMHMFLTVAELKNMGDGKYDDANPLLRQVYGEIKQKDLLFFAALLHDIGKGLGKSHSQKGAKMAKNICSRMGLKPQMCETLRFLIGNHLLLADTAMRRDLDDENVVVDLAETIVEEERLKMLYLITVADSVATGPKAWDIWKENLVRELFYKIIRIIRSGEYTSKKSMEHIKRTSAQARSVLVSRYSREEIDLFLEQMPHSYLLAQNSEDIVEHFEQMHATPEKDISVSVKRKEGICEMVVVAKDRPGLFNKISGVLGIHGINILGAQIYTRSDGTALDIFKVAGYFESEVSEDKQDKIRHDIKRALEGKISLDYRVIEKARRYKQNGALKKPAKVEIDNSSSDFYTIIEVHAQDRIGLLYTITKVMHDLNLDIHLAKVSTNVDKVIDVFYVWDIYGQKLDDEEQISDVKKAILMALEQ